MHNQQQGGRPIPLMRVALIFIASVLGFHLIEWFILPVQAIYPLQKATADVVSFLLNLIGIQAICSGVMVTLPHAHWEVAIECTSLSALIVFASFVIAYPSTIKSKLIGTFVGLTVLVLSNMLRLVLLGWATAYIPQVSHYLHDYVWQIGFLILVAVLWIAWIDLVVKREHSTDVPV